MLRILNSLYFPFVGFLALLQLGIALGCIISACVVQFDSAAGPVALWIFGIGFFALFCAFLAPMYYFIPWTPEPEWQMDLKGLRREAPAPKAVEDDAAGR